MFEAIVVDDERIIRTGISSFINNNDTGFEVIHTFKDGAEAIEYLKDRDAALVITDIKMVDISGIELAKFIYETKPYIKVMLLSGYTEFEYAKAAMKYNVEDYLTKPTDFSELAKALFKIRESLESASSTDVNLFLDKLKQLYAEIITGKADEAVGTLSDLLKSNHRPGAYFCQFAANLFEIIFDKLHVNLKLQLLQEKSDCKQLAGMTDRVEITNFSVDLLKRIISRVSADSDDTTASVTAKLIQYINEHFSENISLHDAAEKVFFSPVYCSRFFKKETGENFSDFLLRVRMENAVKLLRDNKKNHGHQPRVRIQQLRLLYKDF